MKNLTKEQEDRIKEKTNELFIQAVESNLSSEYCRDVLSNEIVKIVNEALNISEV